MVITTAKELRAHWLRPELLALPASWIDDGAATRLRTVAGEVVATLTPAPELTADLPRYLRRAGWVAWRTGVDAARARAAVRTGLLVAHPGGEVTGVQIAALLDVLYPAALSSGPLGASIAPGGEVTLRLWAPTARTVALELCDVPDPARGLIVPRRTVPARWQADTGIWEVGPQAGIAVGDAYRWVVTVYAPATGREEVNHVTDPYSAALTVGSSASVVVDLADLSDPQLAPEAWRTTPAPRPARQVDHLITELHVRDLSRDAIELPAAERGTYRAFTRDIPGTRHLRALAEAGVTTVHLLPVYDIATIEEDRSRWPAAQAVDDPALLTPLAPDSTEQQRLVGEANALARTFNWGYDPLHVMAPEGSYAVSPHGASRCGEVREMVGALHASGLAVVLDQVYNHSHACGQDPTSVLCRIVPGYYSRLSPQGEVETSTCCPNIATEHAMAQRWMVDAVVHWARHYRVDGFRFDLMGHHSRANMLAVRAGLDALTLEADGVDGAGILLYGEGWNFGEVADDARFVQARQGNLGGTRIATFSDRLRDAVVGGTPSDRSTLREPGFATGLGWRAPGEGAAPAALAERAATLLRLGLAGNLRGLRVPTGSGQVRGEELTYAGQPAGYAEEPDEIVSYVDAHDNETFFDLAVLKLPRTALAAERVRVNTLGLAAVAWSQTIGFWHAGSELMRSKSLDHDSYDSGDWFNRIDWEAQRSTFGSGLPPVWRNEDAWDQLAPLLADPRLRPRAESMQAARSAALAVARTRREVGLLRLGSAALIQECVSFPAAERTDVVTMVIDTADLAGASAAAVATVDGAHEAALVVLNGSDRDTRIAVPQLRGRRLVSARALAHWAATSGERLPEWFLATGVVQVPALAAAVLVVPRSGGGPARVNGTSASS